MEKLIRTLLFLSVLQIFLMLMGGLMLSSRLKPPPAQDNAALDAWLEGGGAGMEGAGGVGGPGMQGPGKGTKGPPDGLQGVGGAGTQGPGMQGPGKGAKGPPDGGP